MIFDLALGLAVLVALAAVVRLLVYPLEWVLYALGLYGFERPSIWD